MNKKLLVILVSASSLFVIAAIVAALYIPIDSYSDYCKSGTYRYRYSLLFGGKGDYDKAVSDAQPALNEGACSTDYSSPGIYELYIL